MNAQRFDVLVIGGGLVGLAFANLLARNTAGRQPSLSLAVVDSHPPPGEIPDAIGLRVSALSLASRAVLEHCAVWDHLPTERVEPYRRMCVWESSGRAGGTGSITFDAAEQGVADLGYIVENDLVRLGLWQQARDQDGITLLTDGAPVHLHHGQRDLTVTLDNGAALTSRLLVGADGAMSWVREQFGVRHARQLYKQKGIVLHVATEQHHEHTAWQRFLPGGPVALLPLADGRSSVVWSCPDDRADDLLAMEDDLFGDELFAATAGVLGALQVTTNRAAFPLVRAHAGQYTGERFALLGDAAHQVHPLAGQGANLGLLDAAALADSLGEHLESRYADPGDRVALRRYERWRKGDNLTTLGMMDVLHRLFTNPNGAVPRLGGIGLGAVNRLTPLKRRLADYAMGRIGDLPRSARAA